MLESEGGEGAILWGSAGCLREDNLDSGDDGGYIIATVVR